MQFTVLAISTLLGLSLAAPNTLLNKRDQFNKCSVFGSNCAIDGNRFCDADTGKMSICHQIGWGSDECWVQYTMDPCGAAKREPEPAVQVEKRDEFNKCSVFGSNCAVDGNEFCDSDTGKMSICHQIGWGSGECWVQYTMEACPAKREAEPEVAAPVVQKREPVEKRDLFNKCVTFGNDCAVDENVFCRNGRKSICHQIGWGTDDCWIQYTAESC